MGTHTQTQCARNKYSGVSVLQPQAASQAVSLLTPPVYTVPHWSVTPTANLLQQHLMPMSALWILADLSLVARTISIASEIIGQCMGRDRWNGTGVDGGVMMFLLWWHNVVWQGQKQVSIYNCTRSMSVPTRFSQGHSPTSCQGVNHTWLCTTEFRTSPDQIQPLTLLSRLWLKPFSGEARVEEDFK